MAYVSIQNAAKYAEELIEILRTLGCEFAPFEGVEQGVLSLWEVLERLASPGDPNDPAVGQLYAAGAGIHDLAAKIVTVWRELPDAKAQLTPHLKALATTIYTNQNQSNAMWDNKEGIARQHDSANKVIELYWACLCLLSGMTVELDDPVNSSAGKNPDVIATATDGTRWAFAIKTLQIGNEANWPLNLRDNIVKAADQIDRCQCDKGVIVVNMKNVIDHDRLRSSCIYPDQDSGLAAIIHDTERTVYPFFETEAGPLAELFRDGGKISPVILLVAHVTLHLDTPTGNSMFTELKIIRPVSMPAQDDPAPGTFGRETVCLAADLNHVVQTVI